MTIIKTKYSTYQSFAKDIMKDIDKENIKRLRKGAAIGARVMRKNANKSGESSPGGFPSKRSEALKKSIGFTILKKIQKAKIGSKSSKIHLTEFDHTNRTGTTKKRPLIRPSLMEAEDQMVKVMSERYW